MKVTRRIAIALLAVLQAGLASLLPSPESRAQAYPERPNKWAPLIKNWKISLE